MARFSKEPPPKPERELTNPTPDTGLDLNQLTEPELEELGYSLARKRHRNAVSSSPKCSDCRKPVANPVTSFIRLGYDFIEEGEILHESCARGRYEALNKYLKSLTSNNPD